MKHLAILGAVGMLGLLSLFLLASSAITGDFVISGENRAMTLDSLVTGFFNVESVRFPVGGCGDVARQLYDDVATPSLDVSTGFQTLGSNSVSTINFVIDRTERLGTLDMGKGMALVKGADGDSFISLSVDAVVRVPKALRFTTITLNLHGMHQRDFVVTSGVFTTPSFDCAFRAQDGRAVCDCTMHPQEGIFSESVGARSADTAQ